MTRNRTEDDTFKALSRVTFEEIQNLFIDWTSNWRANKTHKTSGGVWEQYRHEKELFFKSYSWTADEFNDELFNR